MTPAANPSTNVAPASAAPYVVPFAVFMVLLAASGWMQSILGRWEFPLRALILFATLYIFSRSVIDFRIRFLLPGILLGAAVFVLWIGPDLLFPGYRQHWLFQNALTGTLRGSVDDKFRSDTMVLFFRGLRAIVLVPIIEELFWRAWLLRWLISPRFESIPLGTFTWTSMIVSAVLFASEHGPYWEVGLLTGFIYNWWMVRTKSLGDCILIHAVTNACLSAYVIIAGRWEYWL
ncbi:MAG: CAAX prenyl protease-related protein [Bryobacteraceae bacterium]|nr:CAAX prenyl protease-related protein [Bryobacteraceae bacterium]